MSQVTSLARVRARLHETSAGFWTDVTLYSYLDAGQLAVIDFLIMKTRFMQERNSLWQSPSLLPVVVTNTFNLVSGTQEYDVDASANNYRESVGASVVYSGKSAKQATYVTQLKARWYAENSYKTGTTTAPFYYISGSNIGFIPVPDSNQTNGGVHYYIKTPAAVGASQDFTLTGETHLAIEAYALYNAFMEDNKPNEANQAEQEFWKLVGEF